MLITSEKSDCVSDNYNTDYTETANHEPRKNGFCSNKNGTITSVSQRPKQELKEEFEETPLIIALTVYLCYAVLMVYGHLRDFMRKVGLEKIEWLKKKIERAMYHYTKVLKVSIQGIYIDESAIVSTCLFAAYLVLL